MGTFPFGRPATERPPRPASTPASVTRRGRHTTGTGRRVRDGEVCQRERPGGSAGPKSSSTECSSLIGRERDEVQVVVCFDEVPCVPVEGLGDQDGPDPTGRPILQLEARAIAEHLRDGVPTGTATLEFDHHLRLVGVVVTDEIGPTARAALHLFPQSCEARVRAAKEVGSVKDRRLDLGLEHLPIPRTVDADVNPPSAGFRHLEQPPPHAGRDRPRALDEGGPEGGPAGRDRVRLQFGDRDPAIESLDDLEVATPGEPRFCVWIVGQGVRVRGRPDQVLDVLRDPGPVEDDEVVLLGGGMAGPPVVGGVVGRRVELGVSPARPARGSSPARSPIPIAVVRDRSLSPLASVRSSLTNADR